MRRIRSSVLFLLPLFAVACADMDDPALDTDTAPATEMGAPVDAATTEAQITEVRDAWIQAAEAGDAAAIAALYTDDASMVNPEGQLAEGRQAIQDALAPGIEELVSLEVVSTGVVAGVDVASDMGTFSQTIRTPDGQEQTIEGRYVVVLHRQADGSWQIVQHLSSVALPPAGEAS